MKKIYISYDVISDEIIDAFVRKNDASARRDFTKAFKEQSRDDTHVQLFRAYPETVDGQIPWHQIEGIPCEIVWDSIELETKNEEAIED